MTPPPLLRVGSATGTPSFDVWSPPPYRCCVHCAAANTICLVMDYMDIDLRLLLDHRKRELPTNVCKCYLYQVRVAQIRSCECSLRPGCVACTLAVPPH